jgi:hypothetical protein
MFRVTNKGALLRWGALALFLVTAVGQTPLPTRIYSYYKLSTDPSSSAWKWEALVIEPPLVLTRDSKGQAHLSIDPAALRQAPGNCTIGGDNNDELSCKFFNATDKSEPGSVTLCEPTTGKCIKMQVPTGLPESYTYTLPLTVPKQ